MQNKKRNHSKIKSKLHPRNKHRERYDFESLIKACPGLASFVSPNNYGDDSIDFFNPAAVRALNTALLIKFYGIKVWEIPPQHLCPPIPGRADYIHHIAELLGSCNNAEIPTGRKIKCLDIGVGASCIYPIIGNIEYGWSFIGSDIDPVSIDSANAIIEANPSLKGKIEILLQPKPQNIFKGIIRKDEFIDLVISNPPFHSSPAEAKAGTLRKLGNLKAEKTPKPILNFGGQNNELWREGGEVKFAQDMIKQSQQFSINCFWFSILISKKNNLKNIYESLREVEATKVKTIEMSQGNKISRIVAWTYLNKKQQRKWASEKWNKNL